MFETIVIDNILNDDDANIVYNMIMSGNWQFVPDMSYSKAEFPSYGMCQMFKHPTDGSKPSDLYWKVCKPIVTSLINQKFIPPHDIYFTRAFLQFPLDAKFVKPHNGIHVDVGLPHIAAVYYANDSDGYTLIFEETYQEGKIPTKFTPHQKVLPKKGRIVLFDGSRYHCSSQPTKKLRCIINFDLIKGELNA